MIDSILKWLKTPYYFNPSAKFKLKISFFHGLFVFLFLYIFRPFYLSQFDVIILEYTLGIGIIAFLGTFFVLYVPSIIFKKYFHEDNWTVGKNILLIFVGVIFVAFFLWYFGEMYKEPYNLKKLSFLEFLFYTFLVSIFPLTFFVFINEKNVRKKRRNRAKEINFYNANKLKKQTKVEITPLESIEKEAKIEIFSDNKKESIKIRIEELVYITSQGNYACFFLLKNNVLKEKILRVTLTQISKKFADNCNILRCHKSYIVNTKFIKGISGNARGYLLKSDIIPFDVPVSRKFSKQSLLKLVK
ncbi:LytTR family transcriptional regulator DNA-binding domain-containing protein [Polaribacter batillariae]|uniref:LytTR family transcriptional regulator DNA-binding domain-containing protein n=1 Tax=Polaribacter batillariae TaxID=2808900 RepID=A0ABX7SQ35_9FLAO|nr:LytTR family DNA-binding domain-containing protein [Polaribacter batillariae]QTD36337.1 LytTR family transcriptional regulator DNA-binding domain-containing protein [Polaribacter batillariae]